MDIPSPCPQQHKFLAHLFLALASAGLFVLPDYIYPMLADSGVVLFRPYTFAALFVISFLLLATRSRLAVFGFLALFFLLQLGQFMHIAYFGTSFAPHEIRLLFTEMAEVNKSVSGVMGLMIPAVLVVLTSYAGLLLLFGFSRPYRMHFRLASVSLIFLIGALMVTAYTRVGSQRFYPNPKTNSIENALLAFSFFLARDLPAHFFDHSATHWKPYLLEKTGRPVQANIIVVMGESLSSTHMSLLGYGRETTPLLETMREDGNFVYKPGISSGVATKVSLPMFFNVTREATNPGHIFKQETNLVKIARDQGFLTHYYSAQTSNLATFSGIDYADNALTSESMEKALKLKHDDALLDIVRKLDLGRPNFIVLHQRNSHSPFDHNYPPAYNYYHSDPDQKTNNYRIDTYDNSIRFTDHWLYTLINDLRSRSRLPVYVLFTSDHGQMMGENGQFGHGKLTAGVARVPFIFYAYQGDTAWVGKARKLVNPTHYEIGKLLAEMLGMHIRNDNEQAGVYYLNGIDLDGKEGYLLVKKNGTKWSLHEPRPI